MLKSKYGWNPWYELYAAAHGRLPGEQYEHDQQGPAPILPYSNWITDRWGDYYGTEVRPRNPDKATRRAFDAWLRKRVQGREK